jgi:hypothetical protein
MTERTLKRIILTLAVLVVAYAGLKVVEGPRRSGSRGEGDALEAVFRGASPETVQSVSFVYRGDTIRLEPSPEGWLVNGYLADDALVDQFWTGIQSATVADLVATNPTNHERLGVSEELASLLDLEQVQGDTLSVLMGNPGPGWSDVYGRLRGEDDVYLIRGNLRSAATRTVSQWRDKHIAALDTAMVSRIQVEVDGVGSTLSRAGEGWTVDGEPADPGRVRSILSELARLDATDFAPDTLQLPTPTRSLVVQDSSQETLLQVGLAKGVAASWWLQRDEGGTIYQVTGWRAGRLAPPPDSLRTVEEG